MAERARVTRRQPPDSPLTPAGDGAPNLASPVDGPAHDSDADPAADAERWSRLGLQVERRLSNGWILRRNAEPPDEEPWRQVESLGFRVKRLPDDAVLDVGEYRIPLHGPPPAVPPELAIPPALAGHWPHHLVQLDGPPTAERVKRLEDEGVDVVEPVSRYALFVCAEPARVERLRDPEVLGPPQGFVVWTGPFLPAYRVGRELLEGRGGTRVVNVGVYPFGRMDDVADAILELGGHVLRRWEQMGAYRDRLGFLVALVDAADVAAVAAVPWVRSVYRQATRMRPSDERAVQIVAPRLDGRLPPATAPVRAYRDVLAELGVDGSGVVIGFCDTGVDTNSNQTLHRDLRGRLAFFEDVTAGRARQDFIGHGTKMAGAAVGDGGSGAAEAEGWLLGQGVAPGARFGCVNAVDNKGSPGLDVTNPGGAPGLEPLATYTRMMLRHGAHVMNNSWNQDPAAGYNPNAALVDRLVRDPNADGLADPAADYLVIVFAAGNEGTAGGGSIGEPAEAKNPIVVGSSLNARGGADIRGVAATSSRGPARDGRWVPTVVAPGAHVVSSRTTAAKPGQVRPGAGFTETRPGPMGAGPVTVIHQDHIDESGTSVAAAHVSGVCALLIQAWGMRFDGARPSPAMVKALLVNGAEDLAGGPDGAGNQLAPIPNSVQGWGRVCLSSVLSTRPRVLHDQEVPFEAENAVHRRVVEVADPARPLRVTLAWTDPPGTLGASIALMNDLDLEVVELGTGRRFKGNVFDAGASVADRGSADGLNNVECVYVNNPSGRYEVQVIAAAFLLDARPPFPVGAWQDYALVIDNAAEIGTLEVLPP